MYIVLDKSALPRSSLSWEKDTNLCQRWYLLAGSIRISSTDPVFLCCLLAVLWVLLLTNTDKVELSLLLCVLSFGILSFSSAGSSHPALRIPRDERRLCGTDNQAFLTGSPRTFLIVWIHREGLYLSSLSSSTTSQAARHDQNFWISFLD